MYRGPSDGGPSNWTRLSSDTQPDSNLIIDNVYSIAVAPNGHLFVANEWNGTSYLGQIFRSTDLGQKWARVRPSSGGLLSVVVNEAGIVYAGGNDWFYNSTNDGTNWTWVGSSGSGLANAPLLLAAIRTNVFAGTSGGGVYSSIDNGLHWTNPNFGLASLYITALAANGDRLFAGTNGSGVFYSDDYAQTWWALNTGLGNKTIHSIAFNRNVLYVGTSGGVWARGDIPLPVEINSFTAKYASGKTELHWTTAVEVNNYGFEVERKALSRWIGIGFVNGHGSTNAPQVYSFVDNSASGSVTYRLKQIDQDGKFGYSKEVETIVAAPDVFLLSQNYPNPFNPSTTIEYAIPQQSQVLVKVFDLLGREVAVLVNERKEAGAYVAQWKADRYPSGIYICRLQAGGFVATKKMSLLW